MARALEVDFSPEKKVEDSYDLETTGEIFQSSLEMMKWVWNT
jgi:hypothetical protein